MTGRHLLAVFGRDTARAPYGLESPSAAALPHPAVLPEPEAKVQEDLCNDALERAFSASKTATRHREVLGHGTGFVFEATPYCSYAARDGVHVLFAGEVGEWPGVNAMSAAHDAFIRNDKPLEENDAHWLLDYYATFHGEGQEDTAERALQCLAKIEGNFSFVIFDSRCHRVLAARDRNGSQPLYWGANDAGQLTFGSVPEDLASCNPTATMFPAGSLFVSERHTVAYLPGDWGWVIEENEVPGRLMSFVKSDPEHWKPMKAIPRITSKGMVCGAVYKVASDADIAKGHAHVV